MENLKVTSKLDERKSGFIGDLKSVLGNPREKLFTNGVLDTEKLSTFLNNYVQAYLVETVKQCKFSSEQIPQVAVQDLITTPPGDPEGKHSFGNYNVNLNFIEVNKNRFSPEMSDEELMRNLITALTGVSHEFRHFVQAAYAYNGVPESKVVTTRKEADEISSSHHESKLSLDQSQMDILTETLGGSEKATAIKEDMLYGYGKMGLISIAEQFQDETSAYADGLKLAKKNRLATKFENALPDSVKKMLPINTDKRDPLIQAYYYNLAHEVDARENAPKAVFSIAKDTGIFSREFKNLSKESVTQTVNATIDSHRQPKGAVDALVSTACGSKKGDNGITPEMIEKYFNMKPEDLNIQESDKREYVEGAIMTILHNIPQEKIENFISDLKETNIDPLLINMAITKNNARQSSVVPVTREEIIEASPNHFEEQTSKQQTSKQNTTEKENEITLEDLDGRKFE